MDSNLKFAPIGLLSAFILKQLILGTSVSEMGVTFALAATVSVYEYLSRSRKLQELEATLTKKSEAQDAIISKQNDVIKAMAEEIAKVRNTIDGVRVAQGASPMTGLRKSV